MDFLAVCICAAIGHLMYPQGRDMDINWLVHLWIIAGYFTKHLQCTILVHGIRDIMIRGKKKRRKKRKEKEKNNISPGLM